VKRILKFPTRWVIDNHEISGAWDHTPANAQAYDDGTGLPGLPQTQEHTNATYQNAMAAFKAAHPQMQAIYDTGGAVGDVPSGAITVDTPRDPANAIAANYPPTWGSEIVDNVEIFYLDCMAGKDAPDGLAYNDAGKVMLGANQRIWLDTALVTSKNNADIDFRIIISAKQCLADTGSAGWVAWNEYKVQQRSIIDTYTAAGVRGVLWVCSDPHHPLSLRNIVEDGGVDFAGICASPGASTSGGSDAGLATPTPEDFGNMVYAHRNSTVVCHQCFALVEVVGTALTAKIIDQFGDELFVGTMVPTENSWQTTS